MNKGLPELHVQAVKDFLGYSALVTEEGVPVAGCTHRHPTRAAADLCGGRMAREIIVARATGDSDG